MKKIKIILSIFIAIICLYSSVSFSHRGRTDLNGGHWDRSNGIYHYHHGYSAHQHPNGICPYLTTTDVTEDEETEIKNELNQNIIDSLYTGKIQPITKQDNTVNNIVKNTNKSTNNSKSNWSIYIIVLFFLIPAIYVIRFIRDNLSSNDIETNNSDKNIIVFNSIQDSPMQYEKKTYICPRCNGKLTIKSGRYGRFIGCSNYPRCTYTKNFNKRK